MAGVDVTRKILLTPREAEAIARIQAQLRKLRSKEAAR